MTAKFDVLVVGAGASGLAAGRSLDSAGHGGTVHAALASGALAAAKILGFPLQGGAQFHG
ncbi:MAG TPA: hypothetical protein VK437_02135 [Steroidobacteraceae bacterium]|nr:hypothetical protein [Steroidobacteraceae bacterium]